MSPPNRSEASIPSQTHSDATPDRPFDILGIGAEEERTYRWLLAHPRSTMREVGHALALPARKTQRLLDAIEAKGLTTHTPERPCRYLPAAPDMALEALILQRQNALQNARALPAAGRRSHPTERRGETPCPTAGPM